MYNTIAIIRTKTIGKNQISNLMNKKNKPKITRIIAIIIAITAHEELIIL